MKSNKIIGIILIITSLLIPIIVQINNNHTKIVLEEKIDNYIITTSNNQNDNINKISEPQKNNDYEYVAILEIPKINLKRGLVSPNEKYNDVNYNIAIMQSSKFPDEKNGNLILAAHNGNSKVSFFKRLEELIKDDKIYLYYKGYKYIYEIDKYYIVPKTGKVNINRDSTKTTIVLITCKNNSDTEQIIYIGYLANKETY